MSAVRDLSRTPSRPAGWWGMVWLVATEATLFGCLLASYYYLRFRTAGPWPPDGIPEPKLLLPGITTAVLLASSAPLALAATGAGRASRGRTTALLAAGIALGLAFLALQANAYAASAGDLRPREHAYGALFYVITGAHAVHVAAGVLVALGTLAVLWTGVYGRRSRIAVQATALYWHSVNTLALVVYLLVYLVPRLS